MDMRHEEQEFDALHRLMEYALGDAPDALEVARFLLAWQDGGFQECEVTVSDNALVTDMRLVFRMLARKRGYPDALGYNGDLRRVAARLSPSPGANTPGFYHAADSGHRTAEQAD